MVDTPMYYIEEVQELHEAEAEAEAEKAKV
jgi:hypothetical protein